LLKRQNGEHGNGAGDKEMIVPSENTNFATGRAGGVSVAALLLREITLITFACTCTSSSIGEGLCCYRAGAPRHCAANILRQ
jgi:hypothetical protein